MIYTITFNPAIDYVVRMGSELLPGMTNRSDSEECYFGGKGINVSTILKNLGLDNTALGFVAGFTGRAIAEDVARKGIKADFIELPEGISRINVKIKGAAETEINAQGASVCFYTIILFQEKDTFCQTATDMFLGKINGTFVALT